MLYREVSMLVLAAALSTASYADPIRTTQMPHVLDFDFDFPAVPGASGQTFWTFDNAVRDTSTIVCSDLPGCMDGTFTSGNSGEGTFSTDLQLINCTPAPPPAMPTTGFNFVNQTCDVNQLLTVEYFFVNGDPGPVYTGAATCGEANVDVVYACAGPPFNACLPTPAGFINRTYTYAPTLFSGDIAAVGGVNGTWFEL
jgi:hypothetical protein